MDVVRSCFSAFQCKPTGVSFMGKSHDEEVILLMRRHVVTNIPWIFLSFVMLFLPNILYILELVGGTHLITALPFVYRAALLIFWYLIVFNFFFGNYLIWFFNVYLVTDKRIVDVDYARVFDVRVSDAPLFQIQDVTYDIGGVLQTMFNYGDVFIQTAAEIKEIEFERVPNPSVIQRKVSDLVAEYKGNEYGRRR